MADPSGMDEIAAKMRLTPEELARLRDIYREYQASTRAEPGQPGFGIPGDATASDRGDGLPDKWPLLPWAERAPSPDRPPPTDAATVSLGGLATGVPGVTPDDPGTIGVVPGFHTPTQLTLGAYLAQPKIHVLSDDEGIRLDEYLAF